MKLFNSNRAAVWWIVLIALVPAVLGMVYYGQLPDQVASHFNEKGEPDDTQDKTSFLLVTGLINFVIPLFVLGLSKIDPKGENYAKFAPAMRTIAVGTSLLLSGSLTMVLFYNLGYDFPFDMSRVVMAAVGLLFLWIGNVTGQIRPNYFVGIRTPWTMADEEVWRRTHRMGGPVMMIGGLLLIVLALLPGTTLFWVLPIAVGSALIPTVYSFVIYRKRKGQGK